MTVADIDFKLPAGGGARLVIAACQGIKDGGLAAIRQSDDSQSHVVFVLYDANRGILVASPMRWEG